MSRDSMVFYRSFMEALEELSPEQCKDVLMAVCHYAMDDTIPNLEGINRIVFNLIKPQIDANNKRAEDGKKGGRPKKTKTIGFENENHRLSESKPNVNVNENVNVNTNKHSKNKFCDYPQREIDFDAIEKKVFKN